MKYQDTWINGVCVEKGKRDCANRYEIINKFCHKFRTPFTVLDIGANMSYFGLRLIEDFNCSVIAFEFDHFELRKSVVDANKTNRLILLKRKISLMDLEILSNSCTFDLVLAMSVVHHLPGVTNKWIEALRKMGNNLIIEFALNDSNRTSPNYRIPDNGLIIGYGDSHLKTGFKRPIVLIKK